jgi:hypothetical protein
VSSSANVDTTIHAVFEVFIGMITHAISDEKPTASETLMDETKKYIALAEELAPFVPSEVNLLGLQLGSQTPVYCSC